jgi:hypothetical protein
MDQKANDAEWTQQQRANQRLHYMSLEHYVETVILVSPECYAEIRALIEGRRPTPIVLWNDGGENGEMLDMSGIGIEVKKDPGPGLKTDH